MSRPEAGDGPPEARARNAERDLLVAAAVQAAATGGWERAAAINRRLIDRHGADPAGCNRLGKALAELGRLEEARSAYARALVLNPRDRIAARNVERLAAAGQHAEAAAAAGRLESRLLSEPGRSAPVRLDGVDPAALACVEPSEKAAVRVEGPALVVRGRDGARLGEIGGPLGRRLARLVAAGNRYDAVLVSSEEGEVLVREVHRSPEAQGPSFPPSPERPLEYGRLEDWQPEPEESDGYLEPYQEYESPEPPAAEAEHIRLAGELAEEERLEAAEGSPGPELREEALVQSERDLALAGEAESDRR